MTEPAWKAEMRQVRGIPLPDPVDRQCRRWVASYRRWNPTPDDYVKIAATVSVIGVIIYAYACSKATVVSHG